MRHVGEIAALGTALCWTVSALAFTASSRRIGALNVNLIRLALAVVFLALYGRATRGLFWPSDATGSAWLWLSLSGVVGFFIGDLCLFEAFVLMGARVATLMLTLVPPLTALIGWVVLGERLGALDWVGMAVTLAGIWLVLSERHNAGSVHTGGVKEFRTGLFLALGAAGGQAAGLVLSKQGMNGFDAFAATQIRALAGLAGFVLLFAWQRRWGQLAVALRDGPGLGYTTLGALTGPFIGVGLSLVSVQHIPTGVAATIMALVPVLVIPPSVWLHRERVGWRAVAGAVVAVGGVALVCR